MLSNFVKDVSTLTGGKAVAALIRIALIPIISRLFLPDDYGAAALFMSIVGIAVTVGMMSFPQAIVLPERDADAAGLVCLSGISLIVVSVAFYLVLLVSQSIGFGFLDMLGPWRWALPFVMFLQGLAMTLNNWLTRYRSFVTSVVGEIAQSATVGGLRVALGSLSGSSVSTLIISLVAGIGARTICYRRAIGEIRQVLQEERPSKLRGLLHEYRAFPVHNMPAELVRGVADNLLVYALSIWFGAAVVGQYAIVQGLIIMGLTLAGESVRRAYLHRATHRGFDDIELREDFGRITALLAAIALPLVIAAFLYARPVLEFVLGPRWSEAGHYTVCLLPWFFLHWCAMPASALVNSLRLQRFWLKFQLISLLLQGLVLYASWRYTGTAEGTLLGYSFSRMLIFAWLIFYVGRVLAMKVKKGDEASL
jgi:O-antigen/teichoic acid export membrane protein